MTENKLNEVISKFKIRGEVLSCKPYGDGHINETYLIITTRQKYIMQRVNTKIFADIDLLMNNIEKVLRHAAENIKAEGGDPDREAMTIIHTKEKERYLKDGDDCYRMYIFIDKTVSLNLARDEKDFYEAGVAFGKFVRMLDGFNADEVRDTIPDFHNTKKRFETFLKVLAEDKMDRAKSVKKEIDFVLERKELCSKIVDKLESGELRKRVTHNDTKLNNVLLDEKTGKAVAVIDLDTIMSGAVCYDFGDSVRFGCSTALEDEEDLSKVHFSLSLFEVYSKGFLGELKGVLDKEEISSMPLGSIMMTFECGMRFLTDYLDGDNYFRVSKEKHNLIRCRTQFRLVEEMEKCYNKMLAIVRKYA